MNDERKVFCRYCGGEIRTVICDDEGNIHDAEYLKHPYSGVGYKLAHDLSDVPDGVKCPICTYDDEITSIGTWIYDTAEEAYAAATRTPPNRPLTREQVMELDDWAAVWVVYLNVYNTPVEIIPAWGVKVGGAIPPERAVLLAAPPTPQDIEAARKEKGNVPD